MPGEVRVDGRIFIDTNVLAYRFDDAEPDKQAWPEPSEVRGSGVRAGRGPRTPWRCPSISPSFAAPKPSG